VSDTDRLYALSSTYTGPWWDGRGPGLLAADPILGLRWYLTSEREEQFDVTGQVSSDGGVTWKPLTPHQLMADAEQEMRNHQGQSWPDYSYTSLRRRLDAEAADWIDHRIRYVQPDDPTPWRPDTPAAASWQRGGQIWALTLGTIPSAFVLTALTARYADPQPDPAQLQTAARDTLNALALAADPAAAGLDELMRAWRLLDRLTFTTEAGQVIGRARTAQETLLTHLLGHHPDTAPFIEARPDPEHPVHQAAARYLRQLARIGPEGDPSLLADAHDGIFDAHERDEPARPATPTEQVAAPLPVAEEPGVMPGYPVPRQDDLQAAAAWRRTSPIARSAAHQAMKDLIQATSHLDHLMDAPRAEAADPAHREEQRHAQIGQSRCQSRLDHLTRQHALLQHCAALADAEDAAKPAQLRVIVAASDAVLGDPPRHDSFDSNRDILSRVEDGERQIADILGQQRRITRDALHDLLPQYEHPGRYLPRAEMIDQAGMGYHAADHARTAIDLTRARHHELEASRSRKHTGWGGPPRAAEEEVEKARERVLRAEQHLEDLIVSGARTRRAIHALDAVTGLEPTSSGGLADPAARIEMQSRARAEQGPADAAGRQHRRAAPQADQRAHQPRQQDDSLRVQQP